MKIIFAITLGKCGFTLVNSSGKTGMAPFCVQTNAETFTANSCASLTLLPLQDACHECTCE